MIEKITMWPPTFRGTIFVSNNDSSYISLIVLQQNIPFATSAIAKTVAYASDSENPQVSNHKNITARLYTVDVTGKLL